MDKERINDLAKMLLDLRMATNQADAEKRAAEIIASTGGGGQTVASAATSQPDMSGVHGLRSVTPEVTVSDEAVARLEDSFRERQTPVVVGVRAVPVSEIAPEPIEQPEANTPSTELNTPQLDSVVEQLDALKEDETKESFNAKELEVAMDGLKRELDNSRKEVEMLRTKLTRTEEALMAAQKTATSTDRELATPQPRPTMPNHQAADAQKPRGTNPKVDLTKIFGR